MIKVSVDNLERIYLNTGRQTAAPVIKRVRKLTFQKKHIN